MNGCRIGVGIIGTFKADLSPAFCRAAIAGNQIAIIAFFAGFPNGDAVAAYGFARSIFVTDEHDFAFTNGIATIAGIFVAVIAFLAAINDAIST